MFSPRAASQTINNHLLQTIQKQFQDFSSLHSLLQAFSTFDPPLQYLDTVVQDEYSHDILIRYNQHTVLVFDCT